MIDFSAELGQKARSHIATEYFVWFTTVDSHLAPQPRPVWFIWYEDAFLIYSQPTAHKIHQLTTHPNVSLHFNTSDTKGEQNVIVFTGTATIDSGISPANQLPAYMEKYSSGIAGLGATPEQFAQEYSVPIRVTPTGLRGW